MATSRSGLGERAEGRRAATSGLSIVEVLVALALLGLLLALVLPRINPGPLDLLADARELAANAKAARARAISRTTRYRIVVSAPTTYQVARADGASWTTERTVELRPQVQFDGVGPACAEFDSRGRLVSTPACPAGGVQLTFTLRDVGRNLTRRVIIHGAGLVEDTP